MYPPVRKFYIHMGYATTSVPTKNICRHLGQEKVFGDMQRYETVKHALWDMITLRHSKSPFKLHHKPLPLEAIVQMYGDGFHILSEKLPACRANSIITNQIVNFIVIILNADDAR